MDSHPIPYVLEDSTGVLASADFDDIYDRLFLRVAQSPPQQQHPQQKSTLMIYDMGRRSSPRARDLRHLSRTPSVIMEFERGASLGTIRFAHCNMQLSVPMNRYLRKTAIFGGSLSRKFRGSDGREYRWSYRSVPGQEWSCVTPENYLVAHYCLKRADMFAYNSSGNELTIHDSVAHLSVEFLASLTIMRHIAQHDL